MIKSQSTPKKQVLLKRTSTKTMFDHLNPKFNDIPISGV